MMQLVAILQQRQDETYHGGSKRSVQPTPTLSDQLRSRFGDICFRLRGFDICKRPPIVGFGHEFETKDTILGQEHVLREDVHAVDTLGAETVGQGVITVEVLLERAAKDGAVTIS